MYVVKEPLAKTRPSDNGITVFTTPTPTLNPVPANSNVVSSEPSVLRRAIPLRATPLYVVNPPPTKILPSGSERYLLNNMKHNYQTQYQY